MVSITLSVSEEIREKMKKFDEINWSAYIRKQIIQKTREIEELEAMKQQLSKEQEIQTWAVNLQRASRSGRLEELRKKGLI